MKKLKNFLILSSALLLWCCSSKEQTPPDEPDFKPAEMPAEKNNSGYSGTIIETMNAGGYTYARIDLGDKKIWLAGPQTEVKKGDIVQTSNKGNAMQNFNSKTLDRTFESIYFVNAITKPGQADSGGASNPHQGIDNKDTSPQDKAKMTFENIKVPQGGVNIQNVFDKKADLAGKEVTIRAKVVKANFNIMGTNWYHLQDGTGAKGSNDLTITSQSKADVGNTVMAKGALTLNKDFGQGYKYAAIIENATVRVE